MVFLRNLGKVVKIGVTAYITGGIAYWLTAQIYLRSIGKEITFSPLISPFLTIPFWLMHVYGDLKWVGILPQDVIGFLALTASIPLLLLKYRRKERDMR